MATTSKSTTLIQSKQVWQGQKNAPVSVVEFGDYESKECAEAHNLVKELLQDLDGVVKYNFRHFPLTRIHQKSMKAAEAAFASAQCGKFWEFHEILLQNQKSLGIISIKEYAKMVGVDDKRFLTNLVDGVFGWYVRNDLLEGLEKGVREVPAFFINGKRFSEELTYSKLKDAVLASYRLTIDSES
jgi:protein-disulfide isomerase